MTSPNITYVTEANFEAEVLKSDKPVLIDFWASWCGPCKALAPTLEKFADENPNVKVVKIETGESPNLAAAFKIMSIPTLVPMKDGKPFFYKNAQGDVQMLRMSGNVPKERIELLMKAATEIEAMVKAQNNPQPPKPPTP